MTTDTKAVARWDYCPRRGMDQHPKGAYIEFTDHERVVGELKEERVRWSERAGEYLKRAQAAEDALVASRADVARYQEGSERSALKGIEMRNEIDNLRAEVEGLKKDAERRLDLIRATVENSEWRHGARNIYGELRREIQSADAAMEKRNV